MPHVPDTVPGKRVTDAGARTEGRGQPSNIRGGSRMQESCTYGSVRGAPSNGRPYRNLEVLTVGIVPCGPFHASLPKTRTGFEPSVPRGKGPTLVCRFSFAPTFRLAGNQPEATLIDWSCHAGPVVRFLFPPAESRWRAFLAQGPYRSRVTRPIF